MSQCWLASDMTSFFNCSENASILNKSERTGQSARDMSDKGFKKITKCNQNELRSVVDLHRGDENLATFAKIDMVELFHILLAFRDKDLVNSVKCVFLTTCVF